MAQKRKPDQKKLVAEAALSLADAKGWNGFSMADIARKTKTAPEKHFDDIFDILRYILDDLAQRTLDDVQDRLGDQWRDNLFEILMTRFDLVQPHREGYKTLVSLFTAHPAVTPHFAKEFYCSMQDMLELAGVEKSCLQPLHVTAFGAIYLSIIKTWREDDSADLAKTMAAIDKRLEYFERILGFKPAA